MDLLFQTATKALCFFVRSCPTHVAVHFIYTGLLHTRNESSYDPHHVLRNPCILLHVDRYKGHRRLPRPTSGLRQTPRGGDRRRRVNTVRTRQIVRCGGNPTALSAQRVCADDEGDPTKSWSIALFNRCEE